MTDRTSTRARSHTIRAALVAALIALAISAGPRAQQVFDICGCATGPNLGNVNLSDDATFQGIATRSSDVVTFALPPDGVLRFESLQTGSSNRYIRFTRNALNTAVTILVKGDVTLSTPSGYSTRNISVDGSNGGGGTPVAAGVGGWGGHGGFRGGDGAAAVINGAFVGGAGFGPGGGNGTVATTASIESTSIGGTFFGVPELLPLVGGSGGGGGAGTSASTNCTGGGGGGGGGALLIAVNGALTLNNYDIFAEGGNGGGPGNTNCSRGGAGGSGGAIRMIAGRFAGSGGTVYARGGTAGWGANAGLQGRVRFETVDSSAQTTFSADPPAARFTGPSPVASPVQPTVAITSVGNFTPPDPPTGWQGAIDVVLPAPGEWVVRFQTAGVPSGTTVEVKVKPRIGAAPLTATVPLTSCDGAGVCNAATNFNLAAGAYVVEARATFQVAP